MKDDNYIDKIKAVLMARQYTQEELAEEIGVTFSTLNRWLNGHTTPQPAHLRQIERLYRNYIGIKPVRPDELSAVLKKVEASKKAFGDIKHYLTNDTIIEDFLVELTYHSDAIEGSTLSKRETEAVIFDKAMIKDKDLLEHLEAINHSTILRQIFAKPVDRIDEAWVLSVHKQLMQGIREDGGSYARHQRAVRGVELILPHPQDIPEEMREYYLQLNDFKTHPIEHIADMHVVFESIHPFGDGNGRIGRIIMIAQLISHGFAPCIISKESRAVYYECIDFAQKHSPTHMVKFLAEAVLEGYRVLKRHR